jgi:Na+-driven multidrug efflux pump
MFNREYKLIWKLFFSSFSVFFLSTLTSTLGSLVDGVVIGNTMNTNSVAAYGLVTPLSFAFALIGSVLNSGSQNACAGALGRGDKEEAQKIFSLTCASGFGVSLVVMVAILLLSRPIVGALGAEPGTRLFADTRAYLIGYALGLPAITGTKLLSSIMQLDSDDPAANIGLRMVMRIAREISYSSAMNMNNLIIRI